MDQMNMVAGLVALNGGRLVGKTRLQKSVYLLGLCGIDLGFDFDYHHYGPYSEELSEASRDAEILGMLSVEWRSSYGNDFATFYSKAKADIPQAELSRRVLELLGGYETTVLELAATADFLSKNGYKGDPWGETSRRKASKATPTRIEQSKRLLSELAALR
jgi:uncharacterized protein